LLTSAPETPQAIAEAWSEAYGVTVPTSVIAADTSAWLFGAPGDDGEPQPLEGEYVVQVRVALADPADSVDWVRAVVGGTVFGLLGTDASGRDLAQGLAFGLPVALLIGIAAATVSTAIGTGLGMLSGYKGGRTDLLIQRAADVVNNVPLLPLLIFFVFVFGAQLWLILVLLVAFSWPGLTILVRSMVLGLSGSQEVEAARALGASSWHILRKHIFPHTAPYVFTQLIFFVPAVILAEAGLSFLGLGDPSLPTWGQILEDGFRTGAVFLGYWWWVVSPGLLIVLTAMTFMLLALAMEPVVNPRLRRG
jgi:peptide/nickel transport system permease protein